MWINVNLDIYIIKYYILEKYQITVFRFKKIYYSRNNKITWTISHKERRKKTHINNLKIVAVYIVLMCCSFIKWNTPLIKKY